MRIQSSPDQIKKAFEAASEDPAWSASRRLIEAGQPPSEMFQTLAVRPDILAALRGLGASVYPGGLLERALKERVVVETSRLNDCQYCAASHTGTLSRLGIESTPLEQPHADDLTGRERLALAYTHAAIRDSNRIPDALFMEVQKEFSDEEIVELTFLVGLTCLLNLFNNSLQVRYHDEYGTEESAEVVQ